MAKNHRYNLFRDLAIIAIGIVVAIILVRSGLIDEILAKASGFGFLTGFIAGFFFTSVFTVSLSTVVLGNLMLSTSILPVAVFGAAGAVLGDFVLFRFLRDHVSADIRELVGTARRHRIKKVHHLRLSRFLWPLVGALIIASPLPDELGLAILGMAHVKTRYFIPISYVFNFIGIVIVGLIARAIV